MRKRHNKIIMKITAFLLAFIVAMVPVGSPIFAATMEADSYSAYYVAETYETGETTEEVTEESGAVESNEPRYETEDNSSNVDKNDDSDNFDVESSETDESYDNNGNDTNTADMEDNDDINDDSDSEAENDNTDDDSDSEVEDNNGTNYDYDNETEDNNNTNYDYDNETDDNDNNNIDYDFDNETDDNDDNNTDYDFDDETDGNDDDNIDYDFDSETDNDDNDTDYDYGIETEDNVECESLENSEATEIIGIMPLAPGFRVTFSSNNPNATTPDGHEYRIIPPPTTTLGNNMPTPPSLYGHVFRYWNTNPNGTGAEFTGATVLTGDITVYAQWGHEVTFSGNGIVLTITGLPNLSSNWSPRIVPAAPPNGVSVQSAPGMEWPANPTRAGFTFVGWFDTTEQTGGTQFSATTPITRNTPLHARWTPNPTHRVTFNPQGGTFANGNIGFRDVVNGTNIGTSFAAPHNLNQDCLRGRFVPNLQSRPGMTLSGWWPEPNGGGANRFSAPGDSSGGIVTAPITVHAWWVYRVTFNNNFVGSLSPVTRDVCINASVRTVAANGRLETANTANISGMPVPQNRPGYTFIGWFTSATERTTEFLGNTTVNSNMTVFAHWESGGTEVTIRFEGEGGTLPNGLTYQERRLSPMSSILTSPVSAPTIPQREGYVFMGFYDMPNGGGQRWQLNHIIPGNMTVYARWERPVIVTVDFNGADTPTENRTYLVPRGYSMSQVAFIWRSTTGNTQACNPDMRLSTYSRTGNTGLVQIVTNVQTPGTSGFPISNGVFGTNPYGTGTPFTWDTVVENDITVYAQWTSLVIFNTNHPTFTGSGTNGVANRYVLYGRSFRTNESALNPFFVLGATSAIMPTTQNWNALPLANWAFAGWNTSPDPNNLGEWFDHNSVVRETMRLYAHWVQGVSFHSGIAPVGVIAPEHREREFDLRPGIPRISLDQHPDGMPPIPVWSGRRFRMWNTSPDGSGISYSADMLIEQPRELHAVWDVQVFLNVNNGEFPPDAYGNTDYRSVHAVVGRPLAGQAPIPPTRTNWSFYSWNDMQNGFGVTHRPHAPDEPIIYGDDNRDYLELFAHWAGLVTFDLNGGTYRGGNTAPTPIYVPENRSVSATPSGSLPILDDLQQDYIFRGWLFEDVNGNLLPFTESTIMSAHEVGGHITVIAQWGPAPANTVSIVNRVNDVELTSWTYNGLFAAGELVAISSRVAEPLTYNHVYGVAPSVQFEIFNNPTGVGLGLTENHFTRVITDQSQLISPRNIERPMYFFRMPDANVVITFEWTYTPPVIVPPIDVPPVVVPPVDVPPVVVPPVEVPPVVVPPADAPPVIVPPAEVPPTEVPPAEVPPAEVPPTEVPPAEIPPAEVPPANVPPAEVPPAEVPPAEVPPTEVPPTEVPPTEVPPAEVPPTEIPPVEVPPTEVPPVEVPPTEVPPAEVPPITSQPEIIRPPTGSLSIPPSSTTTTSTRRVTPPRLSIINDPDSSVYYYPIDETSIGHSDDIREDIVPVFENFNEPIETPDIPAEIPNIVLYEEPIRQTPFATPGRVNPQTDDSHNIIGLAVSGAGLISSAFLVIWLRKRQKSSTT